MKIYTRYNNEKLFQMAQSLLPGDELIKGAGFNHWKDAATYLEWLVGHGDRVAMNLDMDCFITDMEVLSELVDDFKNGDYTHCGISDGGCLQGRKNISWAVMNPFFNLFNSERIRRMRGVLPSSVIEPTPWEDIRSYGFRPEMNQRKPPHIPDYETCMWEPFNGIFNWLFNWGEPLWLHGDLHSDGISTIIKYKDRPFALHSWYGREFDHDPKQAERIMKLYKEAKG